LKKIGENFAAALQNVGPDYTNDFLKTLLSKLEGKLLLKHYEELFKLVEEVYVRKRKQFEAEEAIKKKSLQ
jgi:actin-related protein